jgi:tetratricopeptide (TPR) repeat protein
MTFQRLLPSLLLSAAALLLLQNPIARAEAVPQIPAPTAPQPMTAEQRGDLFMARQQYLAAIDAYRQAPTDAVILNKLGIAYHHLFALDEARKDYEKALLIRPNYPEAINNLGAADFAERHYKQSIHLYRKALRLMPNSAVIAANLGTAYFARGKYRDGLEAYQRAFRLDPNVFGGDMSQVLPRLPSAPARTSASPSFLPKQANRTSLSNTCAKPSTMASTTGISSCRIPTSPSSAKLPSSPCSWPRRRSTDSQPPLSPCIDGQRSTFGPEERRS